MFVRYKGPFNTKKYWAEFIIALFVIYATILFFKEVGYIVGTFCLLISSFHYYVGSLISSLISSVVDENNCILKFIMWFLIIFLLQLLFFLWTLTSKELAIIRNLRGIGAMIFSSFLMAAGEFVVDNYVDED